MKKSWSQNYMLGNLWGFSSVYGSIFHWIQISKGFITQFKDSTKILTIVPIYFCKNFIIGKNKVALGMKAKYQKYINCQEMHTRMFVYSERIIKNDTFYVESQK